MNPVKHALLFNAVLCLVPIVAAAESKREESSGRLISLTRPMTGVHFRTGAANLQRIYDSAEEKAARNIRDFAPQMRILAEGAGYNAAWIESQPMGGAMYAKRNLDVAINNQLIFMDRQRKDGRLPGAVKRLEDLPERIRRLYGVLPEATASDASGLLADFRMLQGHCFPREALDVYYWMGEDRAFLQQLHDTLEKFDHYLWRYRDSNNDGCLESWTIGDTGEDHSARFGDSYHFWPWSFPPTAENLARLTDGDLKAQGPYWIEDTTPIRKTESPMPMESMDMMSYSYANRSTLAAISKILGNGREAHWTEQAAKVSAKIKDYLWVPEKGACFDRDRNGRILGTLVHNNLRCMYFGSFDQEMADQFVREHLLNPNEFWTPLPLPSIAANDPKFANIPGNNFSGQSQGLTFQRAIRALENYGHHAELSMIATRWLETILHHNLVFGQQYDPFTGVTQNRDGYGPTILAALESIAHLYGVHLALEDHEIWWSGLRPNGQEFTYTQQWGEQTFTLNCGAGVMRGELNGRELFQVDAGVRVVTDLQGNLRKVVGISPEKQVVRVKAGSRESQLKVTPNEVWSLEGKEPRRLPSAPFDYPYRIRNKP